MQDLQLDRGLWNTWRSRGLTPAPLPVEWFRPAGGSPLYYRVDHIRAWLAHRANKPFSIEACWREWFRTETGTEIVDPAELRRQARLLAQAAGPRPSEGVVFTTAGFGHYLDNLSVTNR